jgi:hypothetical protein
VDELERPTHDHKKAMATAFWKCYMGTVPEYLTPTPATLLERSFVDWKMSAIPKGEIRGMGKWLFILTTCPYTKQERA